MDIESNILNTPIIPKAAVKVAGVKTCNISLNGSWKFLLEIPDYTLPDGIPGPTESIQDFDFSKWADKKWQNIQVPGEIVMQGFDILTNHEYYYQREITVPEDFSGNSVLVRFEGVYCNARVWINGKYIRTHIGGFTTWDCDITPYAAPGETVTMTVGVADIFSTTKGIWNPEGKMVNNPSNASSYAHHNIGGINRDVSLMAIPLDHIARTYIHTVFDETFTDAELEVMVQPEMVAEEVQIKIELDDEKGTVAESNVTFAKEGEIKNKSISSKMPPVKRVVIPVSSPKKWDAEHPNLYTLRVTLLVNRQEVQINEEKVGFRQIYYGGYRGSDKNKVYVNGKEVKLRGTCRHDVSYNRGRSMTREEHYAEILAYKNANINYIRTSHYPGTEDLLNICDELGIYVEQETAVCFQGTTADVSSRYEDFMIQFMEMVEYNRNHPCILIWSLGNESNYEKVAAQSGGNAFLDEKNYLKNTDRSRPCIFSWLETGEPEGFSDICSRHYDSAEGEMGNRDVPTLHEEYMHVACYNLDELQRDLNTRNFWGRSIKRAWENIFMTDGALGGALWSGIDDVFYIPDGTSKRWELHSNGRATGYGEWGSVLDAYLREKPEAYLTKKAYSPIRVVEEQCYIAGRTMYIPVKNWFDHTNINEIELEYTVDGICRRTRIKESIFPHKDGVITVKDISSEAKNINLKFYTADGIMIDEYNVVLEPCEYKVEDVCDTPPVIHETENEIRVSGENFYVIFSKATGIISKGCVGEENILLLSGPYLHVTGADFGEWIPDGECIQNEIFGKYAVFTLNGSYENGVGVQFKIWISGNGIVKTDYVLTTKPEKEIGYSEVGIRFNIPENVESVSWHKKGLYTAYPDDHIGRNEGIALKIRPNAKSIPDQYGIKPAWFWKDDMKDYYIYASGDSNNGLTTNDFKTMRENIYFYNVNYGIDESAPCITVESENADVAARVEVTCDRDYLNDRDKRIQYFGAWEVFMPGLDSIGTETYSTQKGDTCELTFEGTGVRYIGAKQKNTGRVKIYIDGAFMEEIDTYSNLGNDLKQAVIYGIENLEDGMHTIKLKSSGGNSNRIIVNAFEILQKKKLIVEKAKLIINNQWYYPNLSWGNYIGISGKLSEGAGGSVVIRLSERKDKDEQ